jgi:hypothetical protein
MSNDDTMKPIHNNWNELFHDCMLIIFICGTIGIAVKFVTFFNQWVISHHSQMRWTQHSSSPQFRTSPGIHANANNLLTIQEDA